MTTARSRVGGYVDQVDDSRIEKAAAVVAATFLLVGILGFIPGITSNFDDLEFAGHESGAELLGLFQVSILHNLVHVAFGVVGLAMARRVASARTFLIGGGAIYLFLWLYGLLIDKDADANFVPVNSADDWLHFALGAGMISVGVVLSRNRATSDRAGQEAAPR